jgi:Holliday junction resolvase RusA-like endonuclease
MKPLAFTVRGAPQGKGRPRMSMRGGFARAYTPAKTRSYESLIAEAAVNAGAQIIDGPVKLYVTAHHEIPKSWSRQKRDEAAYGAIRPTGPRNDLDNVLKAVSDALNGVAYKDDGQVVEVVASRFYSAVPRVDVYVEAVK